MTDVATRRAPRPQDATRPRCAWCPNPIPEGKRRDAITCSKRCRQARHRFVRWARRREADAVRPMRFAYADPPYPGKARKYYADHPDYAGEVDHDELVARLVAEYPDGWALSTSAEALRDVLAACPPGVRVASWHRGERPTKHYRPLNAWEPVIYFGGREYLSTPQDRRVDVLEYVARARGTDAGRVVGAKPAPFCFWVFDLLGALPGDELVDVFPGSGRIAYAWAEVSRLERGDTSRLTVAPRDVSPGSASRRVDAPAGTATA